MSFLVIACICVPSGSECGRTSQARVGPGPPCIATDPDAINASPSYPWYNDRTPNTVVLREVCELAEWQIKLLKATIQRDESMN